MFKRILTAFFFTIFIVSCGGGSNEEDTTIPDTNPTPPTSGALSPNGQKLTLTQLDLNYDDVVAQTSLESFSLAASRSTLSRSSTKKTVSSKISRNAGVYPPVQTYSEFIASRKYVEGELLSLFPVVEYLVEGDNGLQSQEISCDFTYSEVRIDKLYLLNEISREVLAIADIPNSVDKECNLSYRNATLVVEQDGTVYEITSGLGHSIIDIAPAHQAGINQSDEALLVDAEHQIFALSINDKKVTLTQLTTPDAPVTAYYGKIKAPGAFAYDGEYLFAASAYHAADTATYFLFEKNSTQFKILRPENLGTNFYQSVLLNKEGKFFFHYASSEFFVLNTDDMSYTPYIASLELEKTGDEFAPIYPPLCEEFNPDCHLTYQPSSVFGAIGRYEEWIVGDRGIAWNYKTFEQTGSILCMPDFKIDGACDPSYISLLGSNVYAIDKNLAKYAKYDLETRESIVINLDNFGFLAMDYQVFKDLVLVEVTNSINSDKLYVEINLNTGAVIERGIVKTGDRKVISFLPVNG